MSDELKVEQVPIIEPTAEDLLWWQAGLAPIKWATREELEKEFVSPTQ